MPADPPKVDPPKVDPPKKANAHVVASISAIAVMMIIWLIIFAFNDESEDQSVSEITATSTSAVPQENEDILGWSQAKARRACHYKIKDQLASPGTAKFEGLFAAKFSKTDGGSAWRVDGYVDAQNLFGAELRSDYTCTVTPSSKDRATVKAYLEE